ncbi:hypothetical protein STEG23_005086 [Scotinomys teguina]
MLLSGKRHDFSCPCTWVDGNRVDDTVKGEDNALIMTDASKSARLWGQRRMLKEGTAIPWGPGAKPGSRIFQAMGPRTTPKAVRTKDKAGAVERSTELAQG